MNTRLVYTSNKEEKNEEKIGLSSIQMSLYSIEFHPLYYSSTQPSLNFLGFSFTEENNSRLTFGKTIAVSSPSLGSSLCSSVVLELK